jgi:ankyrin repeat protein
MSRFAIVCALVSAAIPARAAEPAGPVPPAEARAAAAKALELVQHSQAVAVGKENCGSCHHQLLPELAFDLARGRGVPFDGAAAREVTAQTFGLLKDLDAVVQGYDHIDVVFEGWLLVAAHAAGVPPSPSTEAVAQFVAGRQLPDGSWRTMDARPPQSHSRFTVTAVCARAVDLYLPAGLKDEKAARLRKAREWLLAADARTTEDLTFRLLGLVWAGADAGTRANAARQLVGRQQADGGWGQLTGRGSDAYSTGEALYALHQAGAGADDAAVRKGLRYLLTTQNPDGSWRVRTRLHPPAMMSPPYFGSEFPHGRNQFISAMGTTWAAAALMLATPGAADQARPPAPDVAPAAVPAWARVALSGTAAELEKLLDGGLKPGAATAAGTTALMLAARDPAKVKLLLARGADVNARAASGYTALVVAARHGSNAEVVKLLLKAGAKPEAGPGMAVKNDASAVFNAVTAGDLESVQALLDAGAKPGSRMNVLGRMPYTPLTYATASGNAAVAEVLIGRGADPNETGPDGFSLLSYAAVTNHVDVVKLLAARGAKVNAADGEGMTPLLYAASIDFGDTAVADALLAAGADPGVKTPTGQTALDLAKQYDHPGLAARLAGKAPGK